MKIRTKLLIATGLFAIGTSIVLSYNLINNQNNKNNDIINENLNNNQSKQYLSTFDDKTKTFIVRDKNFSYVPVDNILSSMGKKRTDIVHVKIEVNNVVLSTSSFKDCTNLEDVQGSEKIAYMHAYVFANCTKLKSIDLSNLIGSVHEFEFLGCTALTSVTLGNKVKFIAKSAFERAGISQINLPDGLESIKENAFKGTKLTSITLPSNLTSIDETSFLDTPSLTHATILSNIDLHQGMFPNAIDITLGSTNLTSNITQAFTKSKVKTVTLNNTIRTIGDIAFEGFNHASLTSIILPTSLVSIGNNSFSGTSITNLPNFKDLSNLTIIGQSAFMNSQITEIELPANLRIIEPNAFPEVTTLNNVNNDELIQYIKEAFPKLTDIQIKGSDVTRIVNSAFENMTTLTTVTFENTTNLYMIGAHAFKGTKISTINLPDSLESIEARAFEGTRLTSIDLKNVDFIDKYAFFDLAITTITLPSTIASIGQNAFNKATTINIQTRKITDQILQGFDKAVVTTITLQSQVNVVEKNSFSDFPSTTIKLETSSNNLDKDGFNKINTLVVNTPEQYNKFRLKDSASITTLKYKDTNTANINVSYFKNNAFTSIQILASHDLGTDFFSSLKKESLNLLAGEFFFGFYFENEYNNLIKNNNLMQNLRQINMDNSGNLELFALTTGINIDSSNLKLPYTGKDQIISPSFTLTNPSLNSKNNKIDVKLTNPLTVKEVREYKHTFTYNLTLVQDNNYSHDYSTAQQTIIIEKANVQIDKLPQDSTITLKPGESIPFEDFNFNFEIESINIKYISSTGKEFKDIPQDPGTYIMRVTIIPKDKININETVLDYTLIIESSMMMPIIYGVSGSILFLLLLLFLIIFLLKKRKGKKELEGIK